MDLVARQRRILQAQAALYVAQLLVRLKGRFQRQQAEASAAAGRAFQAERIVQALAEHLQAAADPQQATAVAQVTEDRLVPATLAQLA